jgi:hypothetical protein
VGRSNKSARSASALVVYLLLAIVLTHPLWLHLADAVPSDIGDPLLNAWTLAWDAHALLSDPLHLFDANIFYPLSNTLAYSEHLLASALLMLPLQGITGEPLLAYNVDLLLSFALSGLGMYLLCLRWTGLRCAAFLAGLAFAFAPYRLAAISHLQLLTLQWLPFTLLALEWLLERTSREDGELPRPGRSIQPHPPIPSPQVEEGEQCFSPSVSQRGTLLPGVLFVLFGTLQMLSSWYLAVFSVLVLGLYALAWLVTTRPCREVVRRAVWLLGCGAVVAAVIAPVAMRYVGVLPQLEAARPAEMAAALAARPGDFLAAAPFLRLVGPWTEALRERQGFTEENTLYPGILSSLLALLAMAVTLLGGFSSRKGRTSVAWRLAALTSVLVVTVALTLEGPYLALIELVPALRVIRAPGRWMMPATLALAGLAGYALAWMQAQLAEQPNGGGRRRHVTIVFGALTGVLLVAEAFAVPFPLARVGSTPDLPSVYHVLRQLTLTSGESRGAVIELPMHVAPAPEYPEARRMLASQLGWWGLVNGYSGFTPRRQLGLGQRLDGFPSPGAMAQLRELGASGVRYLVVHSTEAPFNRDRWQAADRYDAERGTTLALVGDFGPDVLYAINPYGDALIVEPAGVQDPYWMARVPTSSGSYFAVGHGRVDMIAYRLETAWSETEPGELSEDVRRLTLYWRASARLDHDYTVFVHVLDDAGQLVGQADGPPVAAHYPTTVWRPGEIVQDSRLVASGHSYLLGLYDATSGQRLAAFAADGARLLHDAVPIEVEEERSRSK